MSDGKGYVWPEPYDPEAFVCLRVYVPAHTIYLAAFWNAYQFFGSPLAWANDEAHTALDVAALWRVAFEMSRTALDNGEGCEVFDVRQKPGEPCILEKSVDGGETWLPWADLTLCPPTIALSADGTTIIYWCPTCGPDGGPGWTPLIPPDPDYDPAFDDPQTPAPEDWVAPGNDPECVFAANLVEALKSVMERIDFGLQTGVLATVVYIEAQLNIFAGKILSKKAKQILDGIAGAGVYSYVDWHADFEDFDWQAMIDKLACFYQADGTSTLDDHAEGMRCIEDETSPVWMVAKGILALVGTVGVNNAGTYAGIHEAECDPDCDCPYTLIWGEDFNVSAVFAGWSPYTGGTLAGGFVIDGSTLQSEVIDPPGIDPPINLIQALLTIPEPGIDIALLTIEVDGTDPFQMQINFSYEATGDDWVLTADGIVGPPFAPVVEPSGLPGEGSCVRRILITAFNDGAAPSSFITKITLNGPGFAPAF